MSQGSRPERVGDLVRAELSELLARHVRDPGIKFVTITYVRMTGDLQLARVFYTALVEPADRSDVARALHRATPFLRRQLGGRLRLRHVPQLTFAYDEESERQDRVAQALQGLAPPSTDDPTGGAHDR